MSHRLQVLIPPELDDRISMAAQRRRISKGEWVRRALEASLRTAGADSAADPLARMSSINAPTCDIDQMLSEIEAGRK
ncbi:MAG: antitoxin [Candidatus Solibacter usitatus]|nr:antitoxin [Candidatus Solibacter usitatus]